MDYDDLLLNWLLLLRRHPEVRAHLQGRFAHVLVDEYQDTNRLQADIVDTLLGGERNLLVVGDDAQSIYGFRGADVGNILSFPDRYPGCPTFRLETNYRSLPPILALANASIACNQRQFPKELRAMREGGELPVQCAAPVARGPGRVRRPAGAGAHRRGRAPERDRRALPQPHPLPRARGRADAARHPLRGAFGAALLRAAPRQGRARPPAVRGQPPRRGGVRPAGAAAPASRAAPGGAHLGRHRRRGRPPQGAAAPGRRLDRPARRRRPLGEPARRRCCGKLERLRGRPGEAVREVLAGGYRDWVRAQLDNAGSRLDDLEQLGVFADGYDTMDTFLDEVTLMNELSGEDVAETEGERERLVLSTVHQAKGLEWRAVFVLWLAEGRFPSSRAEDVEEERRLFYVACTRAKDELVLCHPYVARDRYRVDVILEPSRFLAELPAEVTQRWEVQSGEAPAELEAGGSYALPDFLDPGVN